MIIAYMIIVAGILVVGWAVYGRLTKPATQADTLRTAPRHCTMLKILVPRDNAKGPLAAEQMFASLHGIFRAGILAQELISFEIAASEQLIAFYVLVPTHLRDFIEGQIYAQYPTVEIQHVHDYANRSLEGMSVAGANINLTKEDYYPIKTFLNFDVDPLAGITGVLSNVGFDETLAIQYVISPSDDDWYKNAVGHVADKRAGIKPRAPLKTRITRAFAQGLKELAFGLPKPTTTKPGGPEVKLSAPEEVALKGIEAKVTKLGFLTTIRVLAVGPNQAMARSRVEAVLGALKQFSTTNLNSFTTDIVTTEPAYAQTFRKRILGDEPYHLNVEEIASVFHFPNETVLTPGVVWAGAKKGEPPQELPIISGDAKEGVTTLGLTSFRDNRTKFGIKIVDRRLHMYIIGKTGTGKSTLIQNMIFDDIMLGRGVAVVDPHGTLADDVINFIPKERVKDVVYFNPADREWPLAFNLLENVDDEMRNIVSSGLMSIFTKLWANVWSARMEYILRNAILAVLEVPDSTLIGIMRILNDPIYRKHVMEHVTDPVVREFFNNEYEKYDAKFRQEAIAPIQNKVGQFLSSTTIRNIVGQPKSTFSLRKIMDENKIFVADLSIGKIGEDNSALLGSMLITKIQLEAMSRANIAEKDRGDFYLYVDEFQNFATESFAVILSEARKYHLNLALANQYLAQLPEEVSDAIFGNVGTFISFRVGAGDADRLVKEYAPIFEATDLVNIPNRQVYIKMAIDGVTSPAFSAHTLPPKGVDENNRDAIVENNHETYARSRADVEAAIIKWSQDDFRAPIEKEYDSLREEPFIIGDRVYKEFSAKGGQRWFFGQPPEIVSVADELLAFDEKKQGKTDGEKLEVGSPKIEVKKEVPVSPSVQSSVASTGPKPTKVESTKPDMLAVKNETTQPKEAAKGSDSRAQDYEFKPKLEALVNDIKKDEAVESGKVSGDEKSTVAPTKEQLDVKQNAPEVEKSVKMPVVNRGHQTDEIIPLRELD